MERTRRGWNEREEIERVTKDWVDNNCRLTERELSLLPLIYERKLVRRDHLEIISENYRNLGNNRLYLLNRSIGKLYRQMVIDKIHEKSIFGKGNFPCIVSLDKGGSILLNVPHKKRIIHRVENFNNKKIIKRILPTNYKHINGINQVEVETILFCEESDNYITEWSLEERKEFMYGKEKITIISDVFLSMIIKGKVFHAYIEFDTGSENFRYKNNFPIIYDKLIKYRKYKNSKLWEDKLEYFPLILLVTQDDKRVSYFTNKCKELNLHGYGIYFNRYTNFLERLETILDK